MFGPPPSPEALARRDAARARVLQEPLKAGRRPIASPAKRSRVNGLARPSRKGMPGRKGIPLGQRDTTLTTEQLAAALDRLGIDPATGLRKSAAALRAAGIRFRTTALRPAVQQRRERAS